MQGRNATGWQVSHAGYRDCGPRVESRAAADPHAEEPAIGGPPGRQQVGEVGQDGREHAADAGGRQRVHVPAAPVAVFAMLVIQRRNIDAALGHQVVVHQDDAQQRSHGGADGVDEVGRAAFPRRERIQHQRDQRRDVAAALEIDALGKHVRNIEGGRHEVRHHVDAQRGHREGQRGQQRQHPAVELGGDLLGVQQHLAVDLVGGDGGDARHQRKGHQVHRQAPQVAAFHRLLVAGVAREIAEVQVQRGEVGDPGGAHRHQRPEAARRARHAGVAGLVQQHVHRDAVLQAEAAGLDAQADRQHQHGDPHRRAGPVLEPAHRFHAFLDDEQLQRPDADVADQLQARMPQPLRVLVEGQQAVVAHQQRHDGARRGRRLRAIPEARHHRAHQRRQVGAPDAERSARQHRVGHAGLFAGIAHQVHEEEDHQRTQADGDQEVDEAAAQQEQAGGQVVAPQAVHVRGPDVEDAEGAPAAFLRGGQVFVVETGGRISDIDGELPGPRLGMAVKEAGRTNYSSNTWTEPGAYYGVQRVYTTFAPIRPWGFPFRQRACLRRPWRPISLAPRPAATGRPGPARCAPARGAARGRSSPAAPACRRSGGR